MTNFGDQPLSLIVSCAYSNFSMCIKLRECVEWFSYVFMLLCFPYSAAPDLKVAQITPRWETEREGTSLPTRNCREYSNIFAARCSKVSAIHVIETNMHERLVLISGQAITGPLSPCPWHSHPHHFTLRLILEILNFN